MALAGEGVVTITVHAFAAETNREAVIGPQGEAELASEHYTEIFILAAISARESAHADEGVREAVIQEVFQLRQAVRIISKVVFHHHLETSGGGGFDAGAASVKRCLVEEELKTGLGLCEWADADIRNGGGVMAEARERWGGRRFPIGVEGGDGGRQAEEGVSGAQPNPVGGVLEAAADREDEARNGKGPRVRDAKTAVRR